MFYSIWKCLLYSKFLNTRFDLMSCEKVCIEKKNWTYVYMCIEKNRKKYTEMLVAAVVWVVGCRQGSLYLGAAWRGPCHILPWISLHNPSVLPWACILSAEILFKNHWRYENSLAVQRLGLLAFTARGPGSVPGQGTKISQAAQCDQKQTNKQTKNHWK